VRLKYGEEGAKGDQQAPWWENPTAQKPARPTYESALEGMESR
jgi:hypothetical protein